MSTDPNIHANIDDIRRHLGSHGAYARCMARLGNAIHAEYCEWFEDETRRSKTMALPPRHCRNGSARWSEP